MCGLDKCSSLYNRDLSSPRKLDQSGRTGCDLDRTTCDLDRVQYDLSRIQCDPVCSVMADCDILIHTFIGSKNYGIQIFAR